MEGSSEMEQSTSVQSLKARFEGLSTTTAKPPPPPSPKPTFLHTNSNGTKPPAPVKPSALRRAVTPNGEVKAVEEDEKSREVEAVPAEREETMSKEAATPRAAPPPRPGKLAPSPRPPSIVRAAPSPFLSSSLPPADPPFPTTPISSEPSSDAASNPFQSPQPAAIVPPPAPPIPIATRPGLSSTPSIRRPAPPPPSQHRAVLSPSLDEPSILGTALALPNAQPSFLSPSVKPAAPIHALSVKNLASRFAEPTPPAFRGPSAPASVVRSPSPMSVASERGLASEEEHGTEREEEGREMSEEDADGAEELEEEEDSSPDASVYSSSPEAAHLPPRPAIPPRPQSSLPPPPPPRNILPPPLPSRTGTGSSSQINSTLLPTSVSPPSFTSPFTRSPSVSVSNASSAPSIPALPPRRELTLSPSAGAPPPLPVRRPSIPVLPLPARPTTISIPSTTPLNAPTTPYIPPPPPTRSAAASGTITPHRPNLGDDGSSDEEDEGGLLDRSQEFPDATASNRRPPVLRNRRAIQTSNGFSAFAVRAERVVTAHHRLHLWHPSLSSTAESLPVADDQQKFLAVEFRPTAEGSPQDESRYLWAATKAGHLYEVDLEHRVVTQSRLNVHAHPVVSIFRAGRAMVTLDESGKVAFFGSSIHNDDQAPDLSGPSKQHRIPDKQTWAAMIGDELWTSSGPSTKAGGPAVSMRSPQIRIYDPSGSKGGAFAFLPRPLVTPEAAGFIGAVTAHAVVPHQHHLVFLGHDNGYVSVWDRATYACVLVQRISTYSISAMCGVRKYLWAGFRTGVVQVLDVSQESWRVQKAWKAHKDPVVRLTVDSASLWIDETLQVASASSDAVSLWDGILRDDWLDSEMHLRQPDYCTYRSIRSLSISWNADCARPSDLHGTVENIEFLQRAITSVDSPDIISFGFQEMIDLEDKKLAAKSILLGKGKKKAAESTSKFSDGVSSAYRQWHDKLVQAVRLAMPADTPYTVVGVKDMVGLFSCIFVKSSEIPRLRDIALVSVKTGMGGRHGSKGAILSRFVIDDSSICFINCHLAAGQANRRQRDRDLVDILEDKASFSQVSSSPGAYVPGGSGALPFDHELVFLSGDLNYRIDARRDVVVSAIASGNHESLLQHDQLLKALANDQTHRLRTFREPPVHFIPTYKYDPGTDSFDSSSKKRIPAWCDRILSRADRADKITPLEYRRWEVNVSDHRPISAAFDMEVKSVVLDKRAQVWAEVESAWIAVEESILEEVRAYYSEA